jgi:hypothetical protein
MNTKTIIHIEGNTDLPIESFKKAIEGEMAITVRIPGMFKGTPISVKVVVEEIP